MVWYPKQSQRCTTVYAVFFLFVVVNMWKSEQQIALLYSYRSSYFANWFSATDAQSKEVQEVQVEEVEPENIGNDIYILRNDLQAWL